ncbi:mucin-5B [Purpureocillium lilacinum]|nr:mucin-5B [Purpureocillium lilacinum]
MYYPWYSSGQQVPATPSYMASPAASSPYAAYPYSHALQVVARQPPTPAPAAARRTEGYLAQPARQTGYLYDQPLGTTPGSYGVQMPGGGGGAAAPVPVIAVQQMQMHVQQMPVYQVQQYQQYPQYQQLPLQSPAAVYVSAPAPATTALPVSFLVPPPTTVAAPAVVYVVCQPAVVQQTPTVLQAMPLVALPQAGQQEPASTTPVMVSTTAATTAPTTTPTTAALPTIATASQSSAAPAAEPAPEPAMSTTPPAPPPHIAIRVDFFGKGTATTRLWIRVADASYTTVPTRAQLHADVARLAGRSGLPDQRGKRAALYVMKEPESETETAAGGRVVAGAGCALKVVADGGVVPTERLEVVVPLDDEDSQSVEASLEEVLGRVLLQQQQQSEAHAKRHVFLAVDVDDMWKGPEDGVAHVPPVEGGTPAEPQIETAVPAPTTTTTANGNTTEAGATAEQAQTPSPRPLSVVPDEGEAPSEPQPRSEPEPEAEPPSVMVNGVDGLTIE